MIIEKMTELTEKHIKHYKTDFYNYDLKELENPKSDRYIWILRNSGTWFFPYEDASNVYSYCLKNDGSVIAFYDVDIKKDTIKKINKPESLKSFKIIYRNSNNVFLRHESFIDSWNVKECERMAKKYMNTDFYNYFEIIE